MSTTGCAVFYHGGAVSWTSKKQGLVTVSTTESEYVALSLCTRKLIKFAKLISELLSSEISVVDLRVDNQSAMKIAEAPKFRSKTVHVPVHYHFVREKVSEGFLNLVYLPSEENASDALTKALAASLLVKHRVKLGVLVSQA